MQNKSIILITIIFCIITFFVTTSFLTNVAQEQKNKSAMIRVVIAKANIQAKNVLTAEMLQYKNIPGEYVIAGAVTAVEEAVGKISLAQIVPGEQIIASKLANRRSNFGLALVIPPNMRAVAVQVDSSSSLAGLIRPGNMVDIACTLSDLDRTVTILQNVQVLAIDQQMEANSETPGKLSGSTIATFSLLPEDAEKLTQAAAKGQLRLFLRPVNDDSKNYSWGANTAKILPYSSSRKNTSAANYKIRVVKGTDVSSKSL